MRPVGVGNQVSSMEVEQERCPHCREPLFPWRPPADSTWGGAVQWVCFSDACPYYVEGWEWMQKNYNVRASYRHRHDPRAKQSGPLPVWSPQAHRDAIVKEPDRG